MKSAGQMFTVSESKNNLLLLGFIPINDLILNTLGFWALNDYFLKKKVESKELKSYYYPLIEEVIIINILVLRVNYDDDEDWCSGARTRNS